MESPLGKTVVYKDKYDPSLLFAISRHDNRSKLGIGADIPFSGFDLWNCYEFSWLDKSDGPQVAIVQLSYPASSVNIIESKSLKLYLGSFSNTEFDSQSSVSDTIVRDLQGAIGTGRITVSLKTRELWSELKLGEVSGLCIDQNLDFGVHETILNYRTIYSNLLRSICPITGQPDTGTVVLIYRGGHLDPKAVKEYIVSYRDVQEFSEHCCEKIFLDIVSMYSPSELGVGCFYNRRGGIDINPVRHSKNFRGNFDITRHPRQ